MSNEDVPVGQQTPLPPPAAAVGGGEEDIEDAGTKSFVVEADELLGLVKKMCSITAPSPPPATPPATSPPATESGGGIPIEEFTRICKRATDIINSYQEQAYLLDPLLNAMIPPLMHTLRSHRSRATTTPYSALIYKFVYSLTKVRGHKTVVRFFPHEIVDIEPTLEYLKEQEPTEYDTWEIRYVLLLWLSILGMIPFAFSTMDRGEMVDNILQIGRARLQDSGKTRDAAGELLARIITRPDLVEGRLGPFLEWSLATLREPTSTNPNPLLKLGILTTLANIFKLGKRQELISHAGVVLASLDTAGGEGGGGYITLRKLKIKLAQRIGLVFLKPLSQNWRYQKTTKQLLQTGGAEQQQQPTPSHHVEEENLVEEEEEDIDIPDEMEDVIDRLLVGLKDKDTVVRWSSAKGIGRIASRLPRELADDVVEHVLELFNPLIEHADSAWHGGCLGIAELARRGLLLPSRLHVTFTKVFEALQFDTPLGTYSVGAHVRDAACYVCWSFARAYSPSVLLPYIPNLANALIVATLFDREINCRRAASAAFQENVGRIGNFPHGIDIIGIADYFAVGNRTEAYLNIAFQISRYPEYKFALVDHIVKYRVGHWDINIRELASKSLATIATNTVDYMALNVIPTLLHGVLSNDTAKRHGSILAIAEVLLALTKLGKEIDPLIVSQIRDILPALESGRLFRGRGGEHVRVAACRLIECISLAGFPLFLKPSEAAQAPHLPIKRAPRHQTYVEIYQISLDENITHALEPIHQAAVNALQQFCNRYYDGPNATIPPLIAKYAKSIKTDSNPDVRRGYCMAIGHLPRHILQMDIDTALDALVEATQQEQEGFKDAETRQQAVIALTAVMDTMRESLPAEKVSEHILRVICRSMQDYSTDHRGDVGSWVRLAAMDGIEKCVSLWGSNHSHVFREDMCALVANMLIQQSLEKMDKVRGRALHVLFKILHSSPPIPHKTTLLQCFPPSLTPSNYAASSTVDASSNYYVLAPCLGIDTYRYHALLGYIVSVGGMGKQVSEISTKSLRNFLQHATPTSREHVLDSIISIFENHARNEHVIIPALKTLSATREILWGDKSEHGAGSRERLAKLIKLCAVEVRGSKDVPKLGAFIEFAGHVHYMSVDANTNRSLLSILLSLLSHRYPLVRKNAAGQIFKYLLLQEDTASTDARSILEKTDWTQPAPKLTSEVHDVYTLLGIPVPKKKTVAASATTPAPTPTSTTTTTTPSTTQSTAPATPPVDSGTELKPFDASDEL